MKFILVWLFSLPLFAISALQDGNVYYENENRELIIITKNNSKTYFPDVEWLEQKNSFPPLIIRFMGEGIGHGVFAGRDIKEGEALFSYEGEIPQDVGMPSGAYVLAKFSGNKLYTIDAEKKGNVGRFVQHTPINLYIYSVRDPESIALINVQFKVKHGKKISFIAYALENINAREMLGFDYGEKFWREYYIANNKGFTLFTKTGEIYPHYVTKFLNILVTSPVDDENCVEWKGSLDTLIILAINNENIKFGPLNDMLVVSRMQLDEILRSNAAFSYIVALHSCAKCLKVFNVEDLMKCGRCGKIEYCGRECQLKHWPFHKQSCKKY